MDQKKTGAFIAQMRKEKGLTQSELAEALLISDKTVSKWETGKGLPEVSLMLPLCDKLGISVNELLTGAKLSPAEYQKNAEANIVKLVGEKSETKFRLVVEVLVLICTILPGAFLIALTEYVTLALGWEIALICVGIFMMAMGIVIAALLEMRKAVFQCTKCEKKFIPTKGAYIMGIHTITVRRLKCPNCGVKSFCKRVLVDSLVDETLEEKEQKKED